MFTEATKPRKKWFESGPWTNQRKCKTVRAGQWKLIHRPVSGKTELFDLDADPRERRDLLEHSTPENAQRAEALLETLRAWSDEAGIAAVEDKSEESLSTLEALGYVDGGD